MKRYLIIACMAVSIAMGHIGGTELSTQTYCGRNLARTLALLCYEYEANADKRSESMYNNILPTYRGEESFDVSEGWLTPHQAHGLSMPARGKRLMGIATECCIKPCNRDELLSYC